MTAKWQYKEAYEAALVAGHDLKAENMKLKEQNDRLRKLAAQLFLCPTHIDDCAKCEHAKVTPKSVTGNWDDYGCKLVYIANELGVWGE